MAYTPAQIKKRIIARRNKAKQQGSPTATDMIGNDINETINEVLDAIADLTTNPVDTFENITVTDTATTENLVVNTAATIEELVVNGTATSAAVVTESVQTEDGLTTMFVPYGLNSPQEITGSGALQVSAYQSVLNTTGGGAYTLGNGSVIGQVKKVTLAVDGGDATIVPANFVFTSVVLAAIGDSVTFLWNGEDWIVLEFSGVSVSIAE